MLGFAWLRLVLLGFDRALVLLFFYLFCLCIKKINSEEKVGRDVA